MAFRFTLETVLRVRQISEEREERLLGQILQQMTQCRQSLADLAARRLDLGLERERVLQIKIPAAELFFLNAERCVLDDLQQSGTKHLADLETLRLQQVQKYESAHTRRKLLATMREEQLEDFRVEQARAEQKEMDDRFSATRHGLPGKVGNDCLGSPDLPCEASPLTASRACK